MNFTSGLSQGPRIASWVFAAGVVYAGNYYYDLSKKPEGISFSDEERREWNKSKKAAAVKKEKEKPKDN